MLDNLIGKPFEYGARGPDKFDCYGICIEVFNKAGKHFPEQYGHGSNDPSIADSIISEAKVLGKRLEKPEPFCIVTFRIKKDFVSHIGIVLEDNISFIHASHKRGVCVERLDSPRWKNRIEGFWQVEDNSL